MEILILILFVIGLLTTLFALFLLITPYFYYSILFIIISCLIYVFNYFAFSIKTKKVLKKQKDSLLQFDLRKSISKNNLCNQILFTKIGNEWVCQNGEYNISFNLKGFLFQKSFIRAMVVRALRYPYIKGNKSISNLLKLRFKIQKPENLVLRFKNKRSEVEYRVVDEGISKNSFLSRAITRSKCFSYFVSARTLKYLDYIDCNSEIKFLH